MSQSTEESLNSLAAWDDQSRSLKDFSNSHRPPCLAKVVRGQYRNIGTDKGFQNLLYVHSVESNQKILAEGYRQNSNKLVRSDQKYSLPVTYQGWFEVLSEDGKAIKPVSNVEDLAKSFPHFCLVRENFKAPISYEDDKLVVDRTRVVKAGEKLNLRNEILAAVKTSKGAVVDKRFLRCIDEEGKNVFLAFDQNTSISPIAGHNNISGVHTIKSLLEKFRLPITVRLVHGALSPKLERNWTSVFRLTASYSEETAFVLPLRKDATMLTIATREPLRLVGATNAAKLKDNSDFLYYQERCTSQVQVYKNSIHVIVDMPNPQDIVKTNLKNDELKNGQGKENISEEDAVEEAIVFEEIEEIYRYVRDGGDVPKPKPRPAAAGKKVVDDRRESQTIDLPEPVGNYASVEEIKLVRSEKDATIDQTHSPVHQSPVGDGIADDADYWEEPIYADISKMKERKRTNGSEYNLVDPPLSSVTGAQQHHPLQNLRQMKSPFATNRMSSINENSHPDAPSVRKVEADAISVVNLPDVPPKLYDEEEARAGLLGTVKSKTATLLKSDTVNDLPKTVEQLVSSQITSEAPKTSEKLLSNAVVSEMTAVKERPAVAKKASKNSSIAKNSNATLLTNVSHSSHQIASSATDSQPASNAVQKLQQKFIETEPSVKEILPKVDTTKPTNINRDFIVNKSENLVKQEVSNLRSVRPSKDNVSEAVKINTSLPVSELMDVGNLKQLSKANKTGEEMKALSKPPAAPSEAFKNVKDISERVSPTSAKNLHETSSLASSQVVTRIKEAGERIASPVTKNKQESSSATLLKVAKGEQGIGTLEQTQISKSVQEISSSKSPLIRSKSPPQTNLLESILETGKEKLQIKSQAGNQTRRSSKTLSAIIPDEVSVLHLANPLPTETSYKEIDTADRHQGHWLDNIPDPTDFSVSHIDRKATTSVMNGVSNSSESRSVLQLSTNNPIRAVESQLIRMTDGPSVRGEDQHSILRTSQDQLPKFTDETVHPIHNADSKSSPGQRRVSGSIIINDSDSSGISSYQEPTRNRRNTSGHGTMAQSRHASTSDEMNYASRNGTNTMGNGMMTQPRHASTSDEINYASRNGTNTMGNGTMTQSRHASTSDEINYASSGITLYNTASSPVSTVSNGITMYSSTSTASPAIINGVTMYSTSPGIANSNNDIKMYSSSSSGFGSGTDTLGRPNGLTLRNPSSGDINVTSNGTAAASAYQDKNILSLSTDSRNQVRNISMAGNRNDGNISTYSTLGRNGGSSDRDVSNVRITTVNIANNSNSSAQNQSTNQRSGSVVGITSAGHQFQNSASMPMQGGNSTILRVNQPTTAHQRGTVYKQSALPDSTARGGGYTVSVKTLSR